MLGTIAQSRKKVCIVIPLCNDKQSLLDLRRCLHDLQTQDLQKTVSAYFQLSFVVITGDSTAKTLEMLLLAVPPGVLYTVAIHSENRAQGVAFGSGAARAWEGESVCTIDADCSYGPEHFLSMVGEVKVCAADVIVACPYHSEGWVQGVQPWRLTLSKQCSRLYRMALLLKLYGYTSIFGSTVGLWCVMFGSRVTISSRTLRSYWVRLLRVIASVRCRLLSTVLPGSARCAG